MGEDGVMEARLRDSLYQVLAILYRYAESLAVIEYPRKMERRSIDVAVRLRGGKRILVKVAIDAGSLPKSEVQELISLSAVLGTAPLIVARMKRGEELVEGVVYDRLGARVVSPETLESLVSGRGEVYVYESKDSFKVRVDPAKLREKRVNLGLSLGDLAMALGTSRKTVYDYERGGSDPTLEKAEKLVSILGEDILAPLDVFSPPETTPRRQEPQSRLEAEVTRVLERAGYTVVRARRTAADMGCAGRGERIILLLDERHPRRRASEDKIESFDRLAKTVGVDRYAVVTEDPARRRLLARDEEINVVTLEEVEGLLVGEGLLPNRGPGGREEHDSVKDS